jgi:cell wall-associated NlpC family hydrolase
LWGGKSPKGFDCSGLVQFGFGLHGVALPRDADEQALCGSAVEIPQAGDLLFFGKERVTHIGVALDSDRFVHARGEVRCNALRHGTPLHDAELRSLWRGTRRVLAPIPAGA